MNKIKWILGGLTLAAFVAIATAKGPEVKAKAPDFSLPDIYGRNFTISNFQGKYVVLEWTNYGCPFVGKHYNSKNMQSLQKEMRAKGVIWFSICSSAPDMEGNMTPDEWKTESKDRNFSGTAILLDQSGKVGRPYDAKTTPDMFVIDPKGMLIYKGAIDNKPSTDEGDIKGATNFVRNAINESLAGKPVTVPATESYGCSVKYAK